MTNPVGISLAYKFILNSQETLLSLHCCAKQHNENTMAAPAIKEKQNKEKQYKKLQQTQPF